MDLRGHISAFGEAIEDNTLIFQHANPITIPIWNGLSRFLIRQGSLDRATVHITLACL